MFSPLPRTVFLTSLLLLPLPACRGKPSAPSVPSATAPDAAPGASKPAATTADAGRAARPKAVRGCKLPEIRGGSDDRCSHMTWYVGIRTDLTLVKGCSLTVRNHVWVVEGATLTLEPGVKLSFDPETSLQVSNGRLVARGTARAPIILTSSKKRPRAGSWGGVGFGGDTLAGTVLEHVVIEHAGQISADGCPCADGAVDLFDTKGRVSILNSTIRNTDRSFPAVDATLGSFARFEGNTLRHNARSLKVTAETFTSISPNNRLGAPVEVSSRIESSVTWPAVDVPILLKERTMIFSRKKPAVLTLPEGARVRFAKGASLEVGDLKGGGLRARKVSFASNARRPGAGDWVGIVLRENTKDTVIEDCTISHAGRRQRDGRGAVTYHGAKLGPGIRITGTTFRDNKGAAISGVDGDCGDAAKPESRNRSHGAPLCGPR
jgi:hypothetical protein